MIDFAPTDEQRAFLDSVDRFMDRHLPIEEVRRRDREHIPPYDLLPAMGGFDLSPVVLILVLWAVQEMIIRLILRVG